MTASRAVLTPPRLIAALATATSLALHLRDEVDLAMLQHRLTGTVDGAMRPSQIALWIRGEGAK